MAKGKTKKRPQLLKLEEAARHGAKKLETAQDNLKEAQSNLAAQQELLSEMNHELQLLEKTEAKFESELQKKAVSQGQVMSPADQKEYTQK